jgi:hypothetical protein
MTIKPTPTINKLPDIKAALRALAKYHYLTINQLQALLGLPAYQHAKNALFSLWKGGFLERLILTKAARVLSYIYVYVLNRHGADQLCSSGRHRVFHLRPGDKRSTVFLEHTILINDFRICLERLEGQVKDFQLESWKQDRQDVRIKIT